MVNYDLYINLLFFPLPIALCHITIIVKNCEKLRVPRLFPTTIAYCHKGFESSDEDWHWNH